MRALYEACLKELFRFTPTIWAATDTDDQPHLLLYEDTLFRAIFKKKSALMPLAALTLLLFAAILHASTLELCAR